MEDILSEFLSALKERVEFNIEETDDNEATIFIPGDYDYGIEVIQELCEDFAGEYEVETQAEILGDSSVTLRIFSLDGQE